MVKVAGAELNPEMIHSLYPQPGIERETLDRLAASSQTYRYDSQDQLKFELDIRKAAVRASYELYRGRLRFRTFRESMCNEDYWKRMENGGFALREGVKPSEGISDIFRHTREYGTECATAIVMVFYKAILDVYGAELFDRTFPDIVLMNWAYLDNPANIATYRDQTVFLPGDCRYFRNPDVDPVTPEWQGENAIDLGNDEYYGHGIGIGSEEMIIYALNKNRIHGSDVSAYLMDTVTRPDFNRLYEIKGKTAVPVVTADPAAHMAPTPGPHASPAAPTDSGPHIGPA